VLRVVCCIGCRKNNGYSKQQTVTKRLSAGIGLQLQSTDYLFHKHAMITGSIVAIVTPMHQDGSLDLNALRNLVDFHVREGTDAIVVVGTTVN
jgi:hypothetical protein